MRSFSLFAAVLALAAVAARGADPAKGQIVYARKAGESVKLHVMNADGTGDRELGGQTASFNFLPTWSPDGKRIAFMSMAAKDGDQFGVGILNADGTGLVSVNAPSPRAGLPAWSPDGKQLAFVAGDAAPAIYIADASGNGARKITPEGVGGFGPFWMPDGKRIGYSRFSQGEMKSALVLVNPGGGGEEVLVQSDGMVFAGANALSREGKKLLFVVVDPQTMKSTLRMWDLGARAETMVTELDAELGPSFASLPLPAWSPDGKSILVPLKTEKGIALFRVSEDGKMKTRVTPEGVESYAGAWLAPKE